MMVAEVEVEVAMNENTTRTLLPLRPQLPRRQLGWTWNSLRFANQENVEGEGREGRLVI